MSNYYLVNLKTPKTINQLKKGTIIGNKTTFDRHKGNSYIMTNVKDKTKMQQSHCVTHGQLFHRDYDKSRLVLLVCICQF